MKNTLGLALAAVLLLSLAAYLTPDHPAEISTAEISSLEPSVLAAPIIQLAQDQDLQRPPVTITVLELEDGSAIGLINATRVFDLERLLRYQMHGSNVTAVSRGSCLETEALEARRRPESGETPTPGGPPQALLTEQMRC